MYTDFISINKALTEYIIGAPMICPETGENMSSLLILCKKCDSLFVYAPGQSHMTTPWTNIKPLCRLHHL